MTHKMAELNLLNLNTCQIMFGFNEKAGTIFMNGGTEIITKSSTSNSAITSYYFCTNIGRDFAAKLTRESNR